MALSDFTLPSFFWGNDPNINTQLRQRIALQMMANKRPYPKTFGEGLSAIGEALGDLGSSRRILQEDKAAQDAAARIYGGTTSDMPRTTDTTTTPTTTPTTPPTTRSTVEGGTRVEDGGYNFIDAQAREAGRPQMPATPGYLVDALQRNVSDPDTQAYMGAMSAREAPGGAASVSPTGASGPFQFTRGTGRDYGLVGAQGDQRQNLDASVQAMQRLSTDNAAAFQRANGRPPTMQELAVMHQQGQTGGMNLLAGQPVSAQNAQVNNLPAGNAARQLAGINRYYGLPDRPVDPRQAATAAIVAQQQQPTQAAAYAPTASLTTGNVQSDAPPVTGAPTIPGAIPPRPEALQPPPVQIAQAPTTQNIRTAPSPDEPGYIMPPPVAPKAPAPLPKSPVEQRAERMLLAYPGNEYIKARAERDIANESAVRTAEDKRRVEEWTKNMDIFRDKQKLYEEQTASKAQRVIEARKAGGEIEKTDIENRKGRIEAGMLQQFGGITPTQVYKVMDDSQKQASSAARGLTGIYEAKKALEGGAIMGSGANLRLDTAKLFTAMGLVDKQNVIANTETFRAAMQPVVASILHQTSGTSQLSEGELKFAQRAAAGDITLDPKSVTQLFDILEKANKGIIGDHQKKVGTLFGDSPQAKAIYGVDIPTRPAAPDASPVRVNSPDEARRLKSGTKIVLPDGRTGTVP